MRPCFRTSLPENRRIPDESTMLHPRRTGGRETVFVDLSDAYGHAFIGLSDPAGNGPVKGFYPDQPFTKEG